MKAIGVFMDSLVDLWSISLIKAEFRSPFERTRRLVVPVLWSHSIDHCRKTSGQTGIEPGNEEGGGKRKGEKE